MSRAQIEAVEAYVTSDDFLERFCKGCEHIRYHPAHITMHDGGEPPFVSCPADWMPADGHCPYNEHYLELVEELEEAIGEVDMGVGR